MNWYQNALQMRQRAQQGRQQAAQAPNGMYYNNDAEMARRGNTAANQWGQQAGVADNAYLKGMTSFNPEEAMQRSMGAAWGQAVEGQGGLNDQLSRLAEQSGDRMLTGFYAEDQGDVVRNVMGDYGRTVAGMAQTGAQMNMQRMQSLGNYGTDRQNMYMDALASMQDRRQGMLNARAQRRGGGFLGTLGSIAGGAIGAFAGGAGAAAGSRLGGAIFRR